MWQQLFLPIGHLCMNEQDFCYSIMSLKCTYMRPIHTIDGKQSECIAYDMAK